MTDGVMELNPRRWFTPAPDITMGGIEDGRESRRRRVHPQFGRPILQRCLWRGFNAAHEALEPCGEGRHFAAPASADAAASCRAR